MNIFRYDVVTAVKICICPSHLENSNASSRTKPKGEARVISSLFSDSNNIVVDAFVHMKGANIFLHLKKCSAISNGVNI